MEIGNPDGYWLVRFLFHRGLAFIYLLAFLVAANQYRALLGESGLLPITAYANATSFRERPSLFYFAPTDRAITLSAWTGVVLSLLAFVGLPSLLPQPYAIPASIVLWTTLWGLYLSFVNAGRIFYGYGWESMLLETGFLSIFLGAGPTGPPVIIIVLLQWVLFRNMFGAGLIKIRGDPCWRDLTCLDYHYETQPMPNPVSWFAHHLPDRFHRIEVLGNHIVEIAVPFLYFAPQPFGALAGTATIGFQAWLMITGNFSWLNALTIVLAIATFSDPILAAVLPIDSPTLSPPPVYLEVLALIVAGLVLVKSIQPTRNMLSSRQVMNRSFDPLHLVNTYGAFGSITTTRYQLVIEGTNATDPTPAEWTEYEFKGQPVHTDQRPRQWAPYHLRLDWQLWFAAMHPRPGPREHWVSSFLTALLSDDDATLELLAHNPFPDSPPEKIRVIRYRYRFTTPGKRAETGEWWHRERVGIYVEPVSLSSIDDRALGPRHLVR